MAEKFFIKGYRIDPENKGIVRPATPLMPLYGEVYNWQKGINRADYMGKKSDGVSPGTKYKRYLADIGSEENLMDVIKNEPGRLRLGKDEKHGASGIGYNYGKNYIINSLAGTKGRLVPDEYAAYVAGLSEEPEDKREALDKVHMENMLRQVIDSMRNNDDEDDAEDQSALMLMSTDDDGLVKLSDMYDDWDAWRDNAGEVQVKYYTPVNQIPWRDYIRLDGTVNYDQLIKDWAPYDKNVTLSDAQMKDLCKEANGLMRHRRIVEALTPGIGV